MTLSCEDALSPADGGPSFQGVDDTSRTTTHYIGGRVGTATSWMGYWPVPKAMQYCQGRVSVPTAPGTGNAWNVKLRTTSSVEDSSGVAVGVGCGVTGQIPVNGAFCGPGYFNGAPTSCDVVDPHEASFIVTSPGRLSGFAVRRSGDFGGAAYADYTVFNTTTGRPTDLTVHIDSTTGRRVADTACDTDDCWVEAGDLVTVQFWGTANQWSENNMVITIDGIGQLSTYVKAGGWTDATRFYNTWRHATDALGILLRDGVGFRNLWAYRQGTPVNNFPHTVCSSASFTPDCTLTGLPTCTIGPDDEFCSDTSSVYTATSAGDLYQLKIVTTGEGSGDGWTYAFEFVPPPTYTPTATITNTPTPTPPG